MDKIKGEGGGGVGRGIPLGLGGGLGRKGTQLLLNNNKKLKKEKCLNFMIICCAEKSLQKSHFVQIKLKGLQTFQNRFQTTKNRLKTKSTQL